MQDAYSLGQRRFGFVQIAAPIAGVIEVAVRGVNTGTVTDLVCPSTTVDHGYGLEHPTTIVSQWFHEKETNGWTHPARHRYGGR